MSSPPATLPIMRPDILHRINNMVKVAHEFMDSFSDKDQFIERNELAFLQELQRVYFSMIVWLALRRMDAKEETFKGLEMVIDSIYVQMLKFYIYKELPPQDWSDLKKLAKTTQEILNRERKFVGKQSDRFRAALKLQDENLFSYWDQCWTGSPQSSDNLWKKVRNLK